MGDKLERLRKFLREFFLGLTYLEMEQTAQHEKRLLQDLFILITFGDELGIPILPPYYSLRIFPYIIPSLESWKKRMLRERDLTEMKDL